MADRLITRSGSAASFRFPALTIRGPDLLLEGSSRNTRLRSRLAAGRPPYLRLQIRVRRKDGRRSTCCRAPAISPCRARYDRRAMRPIGSRLHGVGGDFKTPSRFPQGRGAIRGRGPQEPVARHPGWRSRPNRRRTDPLLHRVVFQPRWRSPRCVRRPSVICAPCHQSNDVWHVEQGRRRPGREAARQWHCPGRRCRFHLYRRATATTAAARWTISGFAPCRPSPGDLRTRRADQLFRQDVAILENMKGEDLTDKSRSCSAWPQTVRRSRSRRPGSTR